MYKRPLMVNTTASAVRSEIAPVVYKAKQVAPVAINHGFPLFLVPYDGANCCPELAEDPPRDGLAQRYGRVRRPVDVHASVNGSHYHFRREVRDGSLPVEDQHRRQDFLSRLGFQGRQVYPVAINNGFPLPLVPYGRAHCSPEVIEGRPRNGLVQAYLTGIPLRKPTSEKILRPSAPAAVPREARGVYIREWAVVMGCTARLKGMDLFFYTIPGR